MYIQNLSRLHDWSKHQFDECVLGGKCVFTGTKYRTAPVKFKDIKKYEDGALVQDAFPYLSADDREFIISGISPAGWEETFGE